MYKRNYVCSVFALENHVHKAWSEMKMAQVIDIQSWGEENSDNCVSQYTALWYGQGTIYKFIIRHVTGVIDLVVYKTAASISI